MKFEYKVVPIRGDRPEEHEAHLNQMGADGWELIAFACFVATFKRPVGWVVFPEEVKR